jgi:hypothetical protein
MRVKLLALAASMLVLCSLASAATPVSSRVLVPEPSSLAMAGMGVLGLAGAVWRKFRN